MRPDVGRASVPTIDSKVDFPDPFAPSTTDTRPASNTADTPGARSARTAGGKVFVTPSSSIRSDAIRGWRADCRDSRLLNRPPSPPTGEILSPEEPVLFSPT